MKSFAVNLSTVFTEVPFLERFKKAHEHGFSHVECQFPYDFPIEAIQRELEKHQLKMVLLNFPPGDWGKGDRGLAVDRSRVNEFKRSVEKGIHYAMALGVKNLHCMSGIVLGMSGESSDKTGVTAKKSGLVSEISGADSGMSRSEMEEVFKENVIFAGKECNKHGLTLLIEPINSFDIPGYFLNDLDLAQKLLEEMALSNVKLQFDFYHIQRIHGDPIELFKRVSQLIGHVQFADVPGRHEPGTGTMNYKEIVDFLKGNYQGYIGLEYTPQLKSETSFDWLDRINQ